MPARGDEGLDRTHTWGRTYWGGALFCLMAELRIRTATNNRFGLEDALRGIAASGGSIEVEWPIERVLTAGDRAVGVPALMELYEQMKAQPVAPALQAIWKNLGIDVRGSSVTLGPSAPQAAIRDAVLNVARHGDPACAEQKP
jgi:predicted metalloprotease with PDZ domain